MSLIVIHLREFLRLSHGAASSIPGQSDRRREAGFLGDDILRFPMTFQELSRRILDGGECQRERYSGVTKKRSKKKFRKKELRDQNVLEMERTQRRLQLKRWENKSTLDKLLLEKEERKARGVKVKDQNEISNI